MKRLFLSVPLLLSCYSLLAHNVVVDGIYYNLDKDQQTASVTYKGKSSQLDCNRYTDEVVIPASIAVDGQTYAVTKIGHSAFDGCYAMTSISIPNSVTRIEDFAFCDCSGLGSITISKSVTHIGLGAFYGCSLFGSIVVEQGNTIYDSRQGCNALIHTASDSLIAGCRNTFIPDNIVTIGDFAFWGCEELSHITIPNGVRSIGDGAFAYCSGLDSIVIPKTVVKIGRGVFAANNLRSIIVDEDNLYYNSWYDCNAIIDTYDGVLLVGCQKTIIPSEIDRISPSAFFGCVGLTSITIPEGVEVIGASAFYGCERLHDVTFSCIKQIGASAFKDCKNLMSITFDELDEFQISKDAFDGCPDLIAYVPYRSIKSFSKLSTIKKNKVKVLRNVEIDEWEEDVYIARGTFIPIPSEEGDEINTLEYSLNYDEGTAVVSYDRTLMEKYPNETAQIVIPEQIEYDDIAYTVIAIAENAFFDCDHISSISIPQTVEYIGEHAMQGCDGLTSIVVDKGNKYYDSRQDCNAVIKTATNTMIAGCKNTTFPPDVTTIGEGAFMYNNSLTSLTIPPSIKWIEENAVTACNNLHSLRVEQGNVRYDSRDDCNAIIETYTDKLVAGCYNTTIPNSVKEIGNCAFAHCYIPDSLVLPNGITHIGDDAFSFCNVTSLFIPRTVRYISSSAFDWCDQITSIIVDSANPYYDSRDNCNAIIESKTNTLIKGCISSTIPTTVTVIGESAFQDCDLLTSITIPGNITLIREGAFRSCSHLSSVIISEGVTEIEDHAFSYCRELRSITLPLSLGRIGKNTFQGCNDLTIYVPESRYNTYQNIKVLQKYKIEVAQ